MEENETPTNANLIHCDFDAVTASAMAGKDIVAMVTDKTGENLLAIAGQQGLSWNMSGSTTSTSTKDAAGNGWAVKLHAGNKEWGASVDGLYNISDEATQMVAYAMANDEFLCLKICERIFLTGNQVKYIPIRMGLAIVTSDNFEAPNEDNATYSMEFEGTGAPWLRETATDEEIAAATVTIALAA